MNDKILLIEDEPQIADFIRRGLRREGFNVLHVTDGETGLDMAFGELPDLVILDIMLPGIDGLAVCRQIREAELQTPILMLTAKDAIPDRVAGLEAGADDYLIKPFAFEELLARVRALRRRRAPIESDAPITFADLTLSPTTRMAQRGSRTIELTAKEYDLLELFMRHSNQVLTQDREFQRRYMFPVEVQLSMKKTLAVEADEGVFPSTKEGLSGLRPVVPDGVHTFGTQTYPADGNCGVCVTTQEKARELSADPKVEIRIVSYGFSRTKKGFMAAAVAPSAQIALDNAGIKASDAAVIKTHNPFASNDLVMAKVMGLDVNGMNNFGSSLIFGHPQGPTGARLILEGIEELVLKGGGYLLFSGCAAGDTTASIVLKVG